MTRLFIAALLLAIILPLKGYSGELKPFTSDGCSAFPDGTFEQKQLWLSCCKKHDFDYWKGGSYSERLASDEDLKTCVAQTGEPEIALLMLAGVRVGGTPFLPTKFRWGYGWPYPKFYGELNEKELTHVKEKAPEEFRHLLNKSIE